MGRSTPTDRNRDRRCAPSFSAIACCQRDDRIGLWVRFDPSLRWRHGPSRSGPGPFVWRPGCGVLWSPSWVSLGGRLRRPRGHRSPAAGALGNIGVVPRRGVTGIPGEWRHRGGVWRSPCGRAPGFHVRWRRGDLPPTARALLHIGVIALGVIASVPRGRRWRRGGDHDQRVSIRQIIIRGPIRGPKGASPNGTTPTKTWRCVNP